MARADAGTTNDELGETVSEGIRARQARELRGARARRVDGLFSVIGVVGELLVTAGVLVLMFLVWQLWWVARADSAEQTSAALAVAEQFAAGRGPQLPDPSATAPGSGDQIGSSAGLAEGAVFALLRVPRMGGPQMVLPIYEGVGSATLAKGAGRYPMTQLPGQIGNFAVAGHRMTHGNPFIDIDRMRPGDVVVVETRDLYAVYRAERSIIVDPTAVEVVAPVPQRRGEKPTEAWMTMTSCEPKFGGRSRYIVFAKLERTYTRAEGLPAGLLSAPAA